ncbi:hypothetical protein ACFLV5_03290 [Chloroflexota bacterium]
MKRHSLGFILTLVMLASFSVLTQGIVSAQQLPTITCPPNVTIECDESSDPSNTGYATATGEEPLTIEHWDEPHLGGCGTGYITRAWTVTDTAGNTDNCQQTITVVDTTPPDISCPPDVQVLDCARYPDNTGYATATDNCCTPTITYSDEVFSNSDGAVYIERTWTATDDSGNSSSCVQIIDIEGFCVGGEAYPVNKLGLLAPWVALAVIIAAGGVYLVRRRAHS